MALSDAQIAQAARGTGLSQSQTAIAVAIALAESGGDPSAHNAVPPDDSYGLWQINMLGSLGPSRRQQFGITSNGQLYDPVINAKAMYYISNGGENWRAWTKYTRGTYLRFMARGNAAAAASSGQGGFIPISDTGTNSLSSIQGFLTLIQTRGFWIRFGLLWAGVGIALYGLLKVTGDNALGEGTKSAIKAGVGLLPGGGTAVQVAKTAARVVK